MIDKSAFNKAVSSLIYTVLRPITEKTVRTNFDHEIGRELGMLVKLTNQVTGGRIDPATVAWKETISELANALKPGGVCKDETIRVQAMKELETVQDFFKQATAKSKATPNRP